MVLHEYVSELIRFYNPKRFYFTDYGYIRLRIELSQEFVLDIIEQEFNLQHQLIDNVKFDPYDPSSDIGNRYCRRSINEDVNSVALDCFINIWCSASKYLLTMIEPNGELPTLPNFGFAPHLFYNLLGTRIPFDEYQEKEFIDRNITTRDEANILRTNGYFVEIVALTQMLGDQLTYPTVIGGDPVFTNWKIVPPNE